MNRSVFPAWMVLVPMQQQSVMLLAARGPDGVGKYHPCKGVVRAYRATVLKSARLGRSLQWGEDLERDGFMGLWAFGQDASWSAAVRDYFSHVDELPHHYHLHLLHGTQILGHKHPDPRFRERWLGFYMAGCDDAHMRPETAADLDRRLGDWAQADWDTDA